MPDEDLRLRREARRGEVRGPIDARRLRRELCERPRIVRLLHVDGVRSRRVRLRYFSFKVVDARRAIRRVIEARELQHGGDVLAIFFLQLDVVRVGAEVVLAVGHAEAALQEIRDIDGGIGEVGRDPQSEKAIRLKVGCVQRVDIGAQVAAESRGERAAIIDGGDCADLGLQRIGAARLDRLLVHERGVVVADLRALRVPNQFRRPPVRLLGHHRSRADARALRRNRSRLEPRAVRE